jgi:hypothetical protein
MLFCSERQAGCFGGRRDENNKTSQVGDDDVPASSLVAANKHASRQVSQLFNMCVTSFESTE